MRVIALVALLLSGCAMQGSMAGVCAVVPMGQNEQGVSFIRYRCEPEKEGK